MNSYDDLEEIRGYLTGLGFKEYRPTPFDCHSICTCFQKRYDDEIGKKYFIDAKIWDYSWTDKVKENFHIEYSCQVYQKGTHNAVDLTFIDWTIDQVEQWLERMFDDEYLDYYEKRD